MNARPEEARRSELVIRTLEPSEVPDIMPIERTSFSTPWREVTFRGLLTRRDSDLLGAVRGETLVGYAACWWVGGQAELGNVAVEPTERGRGTGRLLVEEVLERVRAKGARECFLEVRESNTVARSLYERCGFQVIGRRRNYYSRPMEDALVMRRDLI